MATPLHAAQFSSWQEHSQYYIQARAQVATQVSTDVVTVGSDLNCDYRVGSNKIQNAIDGGHEEIRIANDTYNENLIIDDISIIIKGGYANCADAAADIHDDSQSTIDGTNSDVVLTISGASQRNIVRLENLILTNGYNGIVTASADLELHLDNVWLSFNNGIAGGGLLIHEGNTDVLGTDLLIASNTAWYGGGLSCAGSENSVLITRKNHYAGISLNEAVNGEGGGAYLGDACMLTMYAGTKLYWIDISGISANKATGNGGGVSLTTDSTLNLIGHQYCTSSCVGNNTSPASMVANQADSDLDNNGAGGAIFAMASQVNAFNVDINTNAAYVGGGVAVDNDTPFNTASTTTTCWSPGSCNQIRNNISNDHGGAFFITDASRVIASSTHIQNNRGGLATVAYIGDSWSQLQIKNSIVTGNGDNGSNGISDSRAFILNGTTGIDTSMLLEHTTIADNNVNSALIRNDEGDITILSSIIHEINGQDIYEEVSSLGQPVTATLDCVLVHEDASLATATTSHVHVDDPEFINRAAGDYHLNAAISPAVDYCSSTMINPTLSDIDGQIRGWDDPYAANLVGPYDVGADETYDNDILFKDRFE